MKKSLLLLTLVLCFFSVGGVSAAGDDIHRELLFDLFNNDPGTIADLFHASFLAQVPVERLIGILRLYTDNLGPLIQVRGTGGSYTLLFEKGTAPAQIVTNQDNKITGLWFGNWTLNADTLESVLAEIKAIDALISVCVTKNDEVILSHNDSTPLAVGSTFKLYVLKSVYDMIEAGKASWDDVVLIGTENKSLPTGILQDWPENTPVTVKTLTNLMISISDNTATDHLIELVGRDNIEKSVSPINRPFLKTHEVFRMKYGADGSTREKYLKGGETDKRSVLEDLRDVDLASLQLSSSPTLIGEVEWFFTTRELCEIIYDLRESEEIRINPGLAREDRWNLVGYKGGSEPGVLQYTHLLQKDEDSDIYAVAVTANSAGRELDVSRITELTARLISVIDSTLGE